MNKLVGRKFLTAFTLIGILLANAKLGLGLDHDTVQHIVTVGLGYIIGEAAADTAGAYSGAKRNDT